MKPNFSGTWRFNRAKSRLEIPAPDDTTLSVKHHDPAFELTRTHVIDGTPDTVTLVLRTDGIETRHAVRESAVRARVHWEAADLVFDSTIDRGTASAHNVVRYRLPDRDTLVADERFRSDEGSYDNLWWFDRLT
jgi:hypothetical protein